MRPADRRRHSGLVSPGAQEPVRDGLPRLRHPKRQAMKKPIMKTGFSCEAADQHPPCTGVRQTGTRKGKRSESRRRDMRALDDHRLRQIVQSGALHTVRDEHAGGILDARLARLKGRLQRHDWSPLSPSHSASRVATQVTFSPSTSASNSRPSLLMAYSCFGSNLISISQPSDCNEEQRTRRKAWKSCGGAGTTSSICEAHFNHRLNRVCDRLRQSRWPEVPGGAPSQSPPGFALPRHTHVFLSG